MLNRLIKSQKYTNGQTKMMTSLQNKLLDLTCTHAQTLHATDCKDCIQLVNDITQLFIDEGWRVPQKPLDHKKAEELLEKLYYTK